MSPPPVLISISGGEASGKKTVLEGLKSRLLLIQSTLRVVTFHMSGFRGSGGGAGVGMDAFDMDAMADAIEGALPTADVVVVEGRYLLCHDRLVKMASVKIFVDCDPDVRLARKVVRDSERGGVSLDFILDQYVRYSKPAFEQAILPSKPISDIILPAGAEGPGLDLIAHGVMDDIRGKRNRHSFPGILSSASHSQLPLTLSEADLTTGAPSYYQTV